MLRRKKSRAEVARTKANDLWDDASDLASKAADSIGPRLEEARDDLGPKVSSALDRTKAEIGPRLEPAIEAAKAEAAPMVVAAMGKTEKLSRKQKKAAKSWGKKKHRLRNLVVVSGLGATVFIVVKRWGGSSGGTYAPPAQPTPTRPTAVPDASAPKPETQDKPAAAPASKHAAPTADEVVGAAAPEAPASGDKSTVKIDPVEPA